MDICLFKKYGKSGKSLRLLVAIPPFQGPKKYKSIFSAVSFRSWREKCLDQTYLATFAPVFGSCA
jgi:hypothetical protein